MIKLAKCTYYEIKYEFLLKNLKHIFKRMEVKYKTVSKQYGFNCSGYADRCCSSNFHNYTLLEYLYISKGLNYILIEQQRLLKEKTMLVNRKLVNGSVKRVMCPLNVED